MLELVFKLLGLSYSVQSVSYRRSQSLEHRYYHRQKLIVERHGQLRPYIQQTSFNARLDLYVICCVASLTA
jgi:hypothetical protein